MIGVLEPRGAITLWVLSSQPFSSGWVGGAGWRSSHMEPPYLPGPLARDEPDSSQGEGSQDPTGPAWNLTSAGSRLLGMSEYSLYVATYAPGTDIV